MEPVPVPSPLDEKRAYYAGLNMALEDLYGYKESRVLTDDKGEDIPLKDFLDNVKRVFERKGYDPSMLAEPEGQKLINDTFWVFQKAMESGIADNEIPEAMRLKFEHDAFMFSGFKVHHQLNEVGLSLLDSNDRVKSYETFERDVLKIHEKYNRNYLKSEYGFAVTSAQMAAHWVDIEANKGRYDLQYRTAGDYRVRRSHKALQDITLPADDPFWDKYYPPNGWRCRCTAVEVTKGKYPVSDSNDAIMKGEKATSSLDRFGNNKDAIFRFNPGKDEKLFPPKHPYYKAPEEVKNATNGYLPVEWTPKTIAEAEEFFTDKLGVRCSLKGFTQKDMDQIEEIFRSIERHFKDYPELKKVTHFVGSIKGRIKLLSDEKFNELQNEYPYMPDDELMKLANKWAKKVASAGSNCYAYSHRAFEEWRLSGIAFNSEHKGEKVKNCLQRDEASKWHPVGTGTVKAVIDHELGHEIDRLIGLRTNADFLKLYKEETKKGKTYVTDNLSNYANTNPAEFIAEAWSEFLNNENPRPIATAVGRMVIKKYKEKNQLSSST